MQLTFLQRHTALRWKRENLHLLLAINLARRPIRDAADNVRVTILLKCKAAAYNHNPKADGEDYVSLL